MGSSDPEPAEGERARKNHVIFSPASLNCIIQQSGRVWEATAIMSDIIFDVIGNTSPFSMMGESSGYMLTVNDSSYLLEIGSPIFRLFVSFDQLIHPKDIARIKIETNKIEEQLSVQGKRKVNLDSGYMDYDKVVLASAKYNGQKIYLDHGIWADLTLHYEKGRYDPYPWSFPDFKKGIYNEVFLKIRERYKIQRKKS